MNVTLAYLGRSELRASNGHGTLSFAPNLARDQVAFDAGLRNPLRFREAISGLHDVVINDLRFKPRDNTAYEEWKKNESARIANLRREEYKRAKEEILGRREEPVPAGLESLYHTHLRRYWKARQSYSNYLMRHDAEMWRLLMPCDPVITVADDVVFFECFSADESSYGCLTVGREDGFAGAGTMQPGTTNVDYSWPLYYQFQKLRTYRQTRLSVDPAGFAVAVQGSADYREERIDLPQGWLRGFMQVQSAMAMPMRRVPISREAAYSVLAFLKRHKAHRSPRALRLELLPDRPPTLVLEPWEQPIVSHATRYQGPPGEPVRVWGSRRLLTLARLLPLAERFDLYLLGTGLPSFRVAQMGEMRLTLGLSGWTTNDWTRSSALDLLACPAKASADLIAQVSRLLHSRRSATLEDIRRQTGAEAGLCAAALNHLAHAGQLIYDLAAGVYRWRQIMPRALGEAEIGPENAEATASRQIVARRRVQIESRQPAPGGAALLIGKAEDRPVELIIDVDDRITRGKCTCSHHYRGGIRMGPCRHLLALRWLATQGDAAASESAATWYDRLRYWAGN